MINLTLLNNYRLQEKDIVEKYGDNTSSKSGAFVFNYNRALLSVIASNGYGWDHVSISITDRCPIWEEMCFIKDIFFAPNEVAMQLHTATENHVNLHPFCLHLWRPHMKKIPLPPIYFV